MANILSVFNTHINVFNIHIMRITLMYENIDEVETCPKVLSPPYWFNSNYFLF